MQTKNRYFLCIFAASLVILVLFLGAGFHATTDSSKTSMDVFVGVDAAYDGVEDIERFVDEVKSYTNFFIIGSSGITNNATKLNEVCHYVNDSGLYFTLYMHPTDQNQFNQSQWVSDARKKWGDRFVGLYPFDEPAGNQIDRYHLNGTSFMLVEQADNYTDAADKYVESLNHILNYFRVDWNTGTFPLFTSDYALYEFDYRVGYDVVFAEFGWNHSRPLNVALCRGAAAAHNKDWGVILTYTYDTPPYIESGPELYNDMVTAYQNGAKYIVVFDYAKDYVKNVSYGILQQEHLDALKRFWQYVRENPRTSDAVDERVAYVLPKDYGYGFRGPVDTIWGLWDADALSSQIWNDANALVEQYKPLLDIVYEDDLQSSTFKYSNLIFWNGTTITNRATP
jgi:hypothetical protein